jgi:hypothetical protein
MPSKLPAASPVGPAPTTITEKYGNEDVVVISEASRYCFQHTVTDNTSTRYYHNQSGLLF